MNKKTKGILTALAVAGLGTIAYKNKEKISKESKELKNKVKNKKDVIIKQTKDVIDELSDDCNCKDCLCSSKDECKASCICQCCE